MNEKIPDRVLCIDGGGVKGIVETLMLRYIHFCLQQHHIGEGNKAIDNLVTLIRQDRETIKKKGTLYENIVETDAIDENCNYETNLLQSNDKISSSVGYCEDAEPQLHNIFDIISGTSTGSIISTAISRLHWNPVQLIKTSKTISPLIFPKLSQWNILGRIERIVSAGFSLIFKGINQYSPQALDNYLKETIGHVKWDSTDDDSKLPEFPILGIIAVRCDNAVVQTFNSIDYKNSRTVTIKDAIRASTAAPTYFPQYRIIDDKSDENKNKKIDKMKSRLYVDGGLSANCPANYSMCMLEPPYYQLGCLISIGLGDSSPKDLPLKRLIQIAMNNEETWNSYYKSHPKEQPYLYRITPSNESGIGNFDLADSDKVDEMANTYINSILFEDDDTNHLKEINKATKCLFAKSLRITNAVLQKGTINFKYSFKFTMETRYNGELFYCEGNIFDEEDETALCFEKKMKSDENDVKLTTTVHHVMCRYDKKYDKIMLKYHGVEICGSPLTIRHRLKTNH